MEKEVEQANGSASRRMYGTAEGIAIIEDPAHTPRGRGIALLQRIQALKVEPSREGKLYQLIQGCVNILKHEAALGTLTDELIDRETAKLASAVNFGGFDAPIVPIDEVKGRELELLATGFSSGEIDIVRSLCKDGGKVTGFTPEGNTIAGRHYTRYQLRDAGRPQSWTNIESWHGQFPPLKG
jgi:hypothetical protein